MKCVHCNSVNVQKDGNNKGYQRYKCKDCGRRFNGEKYQSKIEYIVHFNTKLKKSDHNRLTRNNYCVPTEEISYRHKKCLQKIAIMVDEKGISYPRCYYEFPNEVYKDAEHFTTEFAQRHYEDCMINFDLNMKFFSELDYNDFDKYLMKFVKRNKFKEVDDLNSLKDKHGIYILVLDEYKQVYIGMSQSMRGMKDRILQHWREKKPFSELLNGKIDTSILSIDSFGALDTTRIFYKEMKWYQNIDEYEEKMVREFKKDYRLNRVAGGINGEENVLLRSLKLSASVQERNLDNNGR